MSIWRRLFGGAGSWKTLIPGMGSGVDGSWTINDEYDRVVDEICAMRLSAVWACVHLRAETIGSLPLHLRDKNKKIIYDHDLYSILHSSPNAMMTAAEYWSFKTANVDIHGNAYSEIIRRGNKSIISLEPLPTLDVELFQRKSGKYAFKLVCEDNREIELENMFHLKGFTTSGYLGMSRLEIGRQILSSQITANDSAARGFKQSVKVGGFFEVEQNLDKTQLADFKVRLDEYAKPENAGKMMTLLKGMKPIAGSAFRIKPAEAELLASRYMGIEEICRLHNTPPQLIGHSDKASSWASSLEQINLFYLAYGLQPNIVRNEQRIVKSLLSIADRASGIEPRFAIQALNRVDLKTKTTFYASALQNGYYNRDEIRDFEERSAIPDGDKYTVQMNMGTIADAASGDNNAQK